MKAKIFISYRRNDSRWQSKAIYDDLTKHFGENAVFKDLEITPGQDFEERLRQEIDESNVILLLISKNWMKELKKRLHGGEKDYVQYELTTAISLGKYVIPILFDDVKMPSDGELPDLLKPISKLNAISLLDTTFKNGIGKLIETIEDFLKKTSSPKRILVLDSGGIRIGALLGQLQHIENRLRLRYGRDDFRLQQYFNLIIGSGDSALLATLLAQGKSVSEVYKIHAHFYDEIYKSNRNNTVKMFRIFTSMHDSKLLESFLNRIFYDSSILDGSLETGLLVFVYDLYNKSLVPISNISSLNKNVDLELNFMKNFIRSSFATPSYFNPYNSESGVYIDASIYCGRNPSLAVFQNIQNNLQQDEWKIGTENLFILSLGFDSVDLGLTVKKGDSNYNVLQWASLLPSVLMGTIDRNTALLLQGISQGMVLGEPIDDILFNSGSNSVNSLITYHRFNCSTKGIKANDMSEYHSRTFEKWFAHGKLQIEGQLVPSFFPAWFDV